MIQLEALNRIYDFVSQEEVGDELVGALRKRFPEIHFNWCFDDDIGATAKPYSEGKGFNLYLVNSDNYCSCLSNDPDSSSGVVIAEVIEDDF